MNGIGTLGILFLHTLHIVKMFVFDRGVVTIVLYSFLTLRGCSEFCVSLIGGLRILSLTMVVL